MVTVLQRWMKLEIAIESTSCTVLRTAWYTGISPTADPDQW